jgi:hypothetical protein
MSELQYFTVIDGYGEYRPTGRVTLAGMVQLVTTALAFAREQQIEKVLVITTGLAGFNPPHLAERYFFVKDWAKASGRTVRASFVAHPEMIDPLKFGVTVAENNGFIADIYPTEDKALTWLLQG